MGLSLQIPKLAPRSTNPAIRPNPKRSSSSSSSTISQALKTNPFGTSWRKDTGIARADDLETERIVRNKALVTLVRLFPDIKPEVHRELLIRFDGDSQLEICVEQLLRHREGWVKGRLKVPPQDSREPLPREEYFRTKDYKKATRTTLGLEFKTLSRSAIDAVLAEENFCYARARPKLQDLSEKTWRATLNNLNIFRKRKDKNAPPSSLFTPNETTNIPTLKETTNDELTDELRRLYLSPLLDRRKEEQETSDQAYAETVNQAESEKAEALHECQVCYSDVPFESISSCSNGDHIICFDCIRHTLHEALFGQGWSKSIDAERGSLRCVAPTATSSACEGFLPVDVIKRAIESSKSGKETWPKFEDRLASQALLQAQIPLIHCPFCSYAEADPHSTNGRSNNNNHIPWHFNPACPLPLLVLLPFLLPIILCYILLTTLYTLLPRYIIPQTPSLSCTFHLSLTKLSLLRRSQRFTCLNPSCSRLSCLKCSQPWHDPHVCHSSSSSSSQYTKETLLQSLRTAVEAARTSAVKRTCPRCGLNFVKSSGCNKLACAGCGYVMCYLCRKNISGGDPAAGGLRRGRAAERVGEGGGEGYRHFCEHFRPVPGRKCTECGKCELYGDEDEERLVREAGERAEREWRREHAKREGVDGLDVGARVVMPWDEKRDWKGRGRGGMGLLGRMVRGEWKWTVTVQGCVDWVVERVVKLDG